MLPAGGRQGPGLGLERLGGGPAGRLLAPLLVFGGLEVGEGRLQFPVPPGLRLGLGGQGGGVLVQGGGFRLGLGPLGLQPGGGGGHGGLPGPVGVERLVAGRLPAARLVEGRAGLGQRRLGPAPGVAGLDRPPVGLLGRRRRRPDGGAAGVPRPPPVQPIAVRRDDDELGAGHRHRQRLLPRSVHDDRGGQEPIEDRAEPGDGAADARGQRPSPVRHLEPAFIYRNRAEMERRFGTAVRPLQLAFDYRDSAEIGRRFGAAGGRTGGQRGRVRDEDGPGGAGRAQAGQGSAGRVGVAGDHAPQGLAEGGGHGGLAAGLDGDQVDEGAEQAVDTAEGGGQARPEVTEGGIQGVGPGRPAVDVGVGGPAGLVGRGRLLVGGLPGQAGGLQGGDEGPLVELLDAGGRLLLGQPGQPPADGLPAPLEPRLLGLRPGHRPRQGGELGPGLGRRRPGR